MYESSLETLPTEVLCMVAEHLSTEDLRNLSPVNSAFRIATAPCLFEVLQVNCPLREDHIVGAVLRKYGAHVVKLRLNVVFFPNKVDDKSLGRLPRNHSEYSQWYWSDPPASVWARRAVDIPVIHDLLQFKGLPRCKSLNLHSEGDDDFVECGYWDWDDNSTGTDSIYTFYERESWEEVDRKEQKYSWRAALRDMYCDIAIRSSVKEFKISSFLPRKVSF